MRRYQLHLARAAVAAGLLFLPTCATNPVTGRSEFSLISESQEIQMGRDYSAEVVQSVGLVENSALQNYVTALGKTLAAKSERPNLPWEFHVLEDASVNAFALPGGFIFVTRGLLTHLTNEAELVSVVGHEIGHVTARHSVAQISRQQLAVFGLGIGSILSPAVAKFGDIASAGLGVLFLKFGRDDELQADRLGFRYALDNGYDVREMVDVFQMLDRQASLAGGGKLPEWQSTHPDPGNRIRAIEDQLAAVTQGFDGRIIRQNEFFARVDGLVFGENPRLGYFEGGLFLHPDLRFRIEFPQGWRTQNQPDAVAGVSAAQDALMELRIAKGSASAASQEFFSQQGLTAGSVASSALHGNPMVRGEFAANTESGTLRGLASFVEYGGNTYRILTYTPTQKFSSYFNVFRSAHDSFNRLSDAAALNIQPKRVQVERVPRAMTLAQFNQQLPSEISLDLLAIINGVTSETALRAGQMVKRVVR